MPVQIKDLTLIVGSCDKYSFLWKKFIRRFNHFWSKDLALSKYILTETKTLEDDTNTFKDLKCGKISYTKFLIEALSKIDTDYVLWMQDDYFLVSHLQDEVMHCCLDLIKNNDNIIRVGIQKNLSFYSTKPYTDSFLKMTKSCDYSVSMQSSIWDRKKLLQFLQDSPNENPWQFEIYGSKRMNQTNYDIIFYELKKDWYQEAMKKGKPTKIFEEEIC